MKKVIKQACLLALCCIGLMCMGYAQNNTEGWKQFRGPQSAGHSKESLKADESGEIRPQLLWKKKMGPGFSEVLVSEDKIYTLYGDKLDSISGLEYVVCYEAATGKEIWKSLIDSIYIENDGWGDGPRSTPCMDEEYIYCFSGKGKLSAHSLADGNLIWQKDLVKEYGSPLPRWGFSSSPVIVDNKLIIEVGAKENRAYFAFNKADGSEIWSNGAGGTTYNSPLHTTIEGQEQMIFFGAGSIQSLNLEGDTLWKMPMPLGTLIVMPVVFDGNKLFFSSIGKGFMIVEVKNNKAVELLKGSSMKNDFSTCVYHDGYIYGFHIAALRCISAETGEVKWSKRGFGKGSLIIVDDKLMVLSDKSKLAIAKASPEAYMELGWVQAMEPGKAWTAPSYHKGRVYVRNLEEIACYQLN